MGLLDRCEGRRLQSPEEMWVEFSERSGFPAASMAPRVNGPGISVQPNMHIPSLVDLPSCHRFAHLPWAMLPLR